MDEFDWMDSRTARRTRNSEEVRADEVTRRATLLAHLGYSEATALARLRANLEWEYESMGKATVAKKLGALIGDAYKRAGGPTASTRAPDAISARKKKLIKRRVTAK